MKKKIAIFGAGIAGLAAARELARAGHEVDVYEADDHIGGLASTFRSDDGFIYDNGPRFILSTLAEKVGIADRCERVKYLEDLYVGGRHYRFPFGFIRDPRYAASVVAAMLTRFFHRAPENLGEFLRTYYGRIFSRDVLIPLLEKWSGVPAEEMSIDFAHRLLPTNVSYVVHSLIKKFRGGIAEDYYEKGRYFVYPRGSMSVLLDRLAETPGLRMHLRSGLTKLTSDGRRITAAALANADVSADYYVSTIPLSALVGAIDEPGEMAAWERLRYRGIVILFIKINRPRILDHIWTWFPERHYRFYRISEVKNAVPYLAPPDKTMIAVEFACERDDAVWTSSEEEVYATVRHDLETIYGVGREEIVGFDLKRSAHAYPVLRKNTERLQRGLTHQTQFQNLLIAGRTGMFQYRMMEGSYDSGISCAETVLRLIEGKSPADTESPATDRYGRPLVAPD
ncbi:MAG: FAD-dependent oxidoreductase [Pseudomonadota bacterium]